MPQAEPLSIGLCAQLACILDVAVHKPGNVSIASGRHDMNYVDMLFSAAAIAPVIDQAPLQSLGKTIFDSIEATRRVTRVNTNLGIVLLLAPLATVPAHLDLRGGLMRTLMRLTVDDAVMAYEAIRLASPGGLGKVEQQDVSQVPTVNLREAMALAADRDAIARQYVNDFKQVFEGAEIVRTELPNNKLGLRSVITNMYLEFLAKHPDSLIQRKRGSTAASRVSAWAREMLRLGDGERLARCWDLSTIDNPGTTADLVVASLFVALRTGMIRMPLDLPFFTDSAPYAR